METKVGKKIFNGIAIGKIHFHKKAENVIERKKVEDVDAEIARYEAAKEDAISQLNDLYEKAVVEVGEANAEIFNVQAMMLEDDDYNDSITNIITAQQVNAEYAAATTGDNFAEMFANMDEEYFKARAIDVKDITNRVIAVLCGNAEVKQMSDEPVIIAADDLAPSETVQMDKSKLLAFVTRLGSANSHTAILARTMGIPALVGVEISENWDGKIGVVDGYEGKFVVDPEMPVLEEYFKKKASDAEQKKLLLALKGKENITKAGKKIKEISKAIREELLQEGFQIGDVEEGIMIETPAAALLSDELAREVDFFSIGTNDLTQYTLAIDRQNAKLDSFYDAHHPAVLKFIQMVINNAHAAGIWAGICGELGADLELTQTFIQMGIDELSVSPGCILPLRKKIRETD